MAAFIVAIYYERAVVPGMDVYEADVPGVGRKFELPIGDGERLIVVIHHDGKRELFVRPSEGADSERVASLTGKQARKLGSILEGAYFQPVELDQVQVPLGEAIIEWVEIDADSPIVGRTLRESEARQRTGVSIIAIQRGEETIANPDPDVEVRAGDILVALGTREEQAALTELVGPND